MTVVLRVLSKSDAESLAEMVPIFNDQRIAELEKWLQENKPSSRVQFLREELQAAYHNFLWLYQVRFWWWNRKNALHERLVRQISLLLVDDQISLEELEYIFRLMHGQYIIQFSSQWRESLAEQLLYVCEKEWSQRECKDAIEAACYAICHYCPETAVAAGAHEISTRYIQSLTWKK